MNIEFYSSHKFFLIFNNIPFTFLINKCSSEAFMVKDSEMAWPKADDTKHMAGPNEEIVLSSNTKIDLMSFKLSLFNQILLTWDVSYVSVSRLCFVFSKLSLWTNFFSKAGMLLVEKFYSVISFSTFASQYYFWKKCFFPKVWVYNKVWYQ